MSAGLRTNRVMSVHPPWNVWTRRRKSRALLKRRSFLRMTGVGNFPVVLLLSPPCYFPPSASCFSPHVCFCTCLCDQCGVSSWFWFSTIVYIPWSLLPVTFWRHEGRLRLLFFFFLSFFCPTPPLIAYNTTIVNLLIFPMRGSGATPMIFSTIVCFSQTHSRTHELCMQV